MPRLPPSLLRHAAGRNTHLPRLLRECRDLDSAANELRWLTEHARDTKLHDTRSAAVINARLTQYVHRRSKGEPLQYVLGSQPFGELDVLCRKGVLIPRPETELYTTNVAAVLKEMCGDGVIGGQRPIRIADLCTGTGCIALLLHALLRPLQLYACEFPALRIFGADVSAYALQLAQRSLRHNIDIDALHECSANEISFDYLDVLDLGKKIKKADHATAGHTADLLPAQIKFVKDGWDVIVSNPPYISTDDYAPGGSVGRSVREHEPILALVPPPVIDDDNYANMDRADQFYEALLHIARKTETKLLVMEVGDSAQAGRVRKLASGILADCSLIETWRDDGTFDQHSTALELQRATMCGEPAHERAIVVWLAEWRDWRLERTKRG